MAITLERRIGRHLRELKQRPLDELLAERYEKLRRVGVVAEAAVGSVALGQEGAAQGPPAS